MRFALPFAPSSRRMDTIMTTKRKATSPCVYVAEFGFATGRPTAMFLSALPHNFAWSANCLGQMRAGFARTRENAERATVGMTGVIIIETQIGTLRRNKKSDREVIARTLAGNVRTVFIPEAE